MTNKQRDKQTKRHTNKDTERQREWPSNLIFFYIRLPLFPPVGRFKASLTWGVWS